MEEQKESRQEAKKEKTKKVIPLKDFMIRCNEFSYDLIKGEAIEVDSRFLPNLKTEKVIK
jgi:hypothetical protein